MTTREKLKIILAVAAADGCNLDTRINTEKLAEFLIAQGVTVLPEGAVILTREEITALNEYQTKHAGNNTGGRIKWRKNKVNTTVGK